MKNKSDSSTVKLSDQDVAIRFREGCPACSAQVRRVVCKGTRKDGKEYTSMFYGCPNQCKSLITGTRYSLTIGAKECRETRME